LLDKCEVLVLQGLMGSSIEITDSEAQNPYSTSFLRTDPIFPL
jgi:hypothetical protein